MALKYKHRAKELMRFVLQVQELGHVPESFLRMGFFQVMKHAHTKVDSDRGSFYSSFTGFPLSLKNLPRLYNGREVLSRLFDLFGSCCPVCSFVSPERVIFDCDYSHCTKTPMEDVGIYYQPLCRDCAGRYYRFKRHQELSGVDRFSGFLEAELERRSQIATREIKLKRRETVVVEFDLKQRCQKRAYEQYLKADNYEYSIFELSGALRVLSDYGVEDFSPFQALAHVKKAAEHLESNQELQEIVLLVLEKINHIIESKKDE